MKTYSNQYKLLFIFTWAFLYLIHPSWTLPISAAARGFLYFGLITYFAVSAYILHRWFNSFSVNEPVMLCPHGFWEHVRNNVHLFIICCVAAVLHIYPISSPIYLVGDEALFLQGGLWIFDYFGPFWHRVMQYAFWTAITLLLIMAAKKRAGILDMKIEKIQEYIKMHFILILFSLCFLVIYFYLIYDLPYHITMLRYPPLQKILYLMSYYLVGINYIGPRIVQLTFYILSAVYLYRTVILFADKETALLGASIYLFSPIIFAHAHFAELASGVVFFIVIIAYYFLRFLLYEDNRGLLLSSFFIGTGFLYKRDIFLMFFICSAYLVFHYLKNKKPSLITPLKILLLSLIPIVPWMTIGKFFNWRNSGLSLHQFTSLEKITAWILMIPASMTWNVFVLIILSVIFVLIFKRNTVSLFFGFLFLTLYLFYTAQYLGQWDRMSTAFYPSISIFLATFLTSISHKIKWKHAYKVVFSVITVYLIALCIIPLIPSLKGQTAIYKNVKAQYFPSRQAMEWVRDNVKDGERILTLKFKSDLFYRDKYGIDNDKISSFWYHSGEVSTPQKLLTFCRENNISYIIFPSGPSFIMGPANKPILEYLTENKEGKFIMAAKYNLRDNYIYVYKLKENS